MNREDDVRNGMEAFYSTVRERDDAIAECHRLRIQVAELTGSKAVLEAQNRRLQEQNSVLTAALATANAHIRMNHHAYVDMANHTDRAIQSAEALELTDEAPPTLSPEAQAISEEIERSLAQQPEQPQPPRFIANIAQGVGRRRPAQERTKLDA